MELAWGVLDKFYSKTDEVVYYAAALIIHPARHTEYIKNNWPWKWSGPTLTKVKQLWAAYRDDISLSSEEDHEQPPIQKQRTELDEIQQSLKTTQRRHKAKDEWEDYATYPAFDLDEGVHPLEWWGMPPHKTRWPKLSLFARNILSMPAMSDEPERVFSGARRTISWDRAQLGWESIERGECLKHWKTHGILERVVQQQGGVDSVEKARATIV